MCRRGTTNGSPSAKYSQITLFTKVSINLPYYVLCIYKTFILLQGEVETQQQDSGLGSLFGDNELTELALPRRDDCLGLATCAVWYETRSRRPMLIYSNKVASTCIA